MDFLAAVYKINDLLKLRLEDGSHAIVPNADFKSLSEGKKGKAHLVPKSVIEDLYISKASKLLEKVLKDVFVEISNDPTITVAYKENVIY